MVGTRTVFLVPAKASSSPISTLVAQIRAAAGGLAAPAAPAAAEAAEHLLEDVLEAGAEGVAAAAARAAAALLEGGMAEAVIGGALLAILQDVVGLVHFLEPALGVLVTLVAVRVIASSPACDRPSSGRPRSPRARRRESRSNPASPWSARSSPTGSVQRNGARGDSPAGPRSDMPNRQLARSAVIQAPRPTDRPRAAACLSRASSCRVDFLEVGIDHLVVAAAGPPPVPAPPGPPRRRCSAACCALYSASPIFMPACDSVSAAAQASARRPPARCGPRPSPSRPRPSPPRRPCRHCSFSVLSLLWISASAWLRASTVSRRFLSASALPRPP